MRAPTLIFLRGHYTDGSLVHHVGDEVPPGLFSRETINRAIDEGFLGECDSSERRSIWRLLHRFSGCKEKQEPTPQEKAESCL